jgi:hypothetical protein
LSRPQINFWTKILLTMVFIFCQVFTIVFEMISPSKTAQIIELFYYNYFFNLVRTRAII